ncbi:MAG: YtxH domain-containing protein [bacterium]
MAKGRGFVAGAAIGAAIAGGLALLFAPKAGKELREDIAIKAHEVSTDLDTKIKQAKIDIDILTGNDKDKRLELINQAEDLKLALTTKSSEFGKSGKKVTRVAAHETDKMIQDGKALVVELNSYKTDALKDTKKFAQKATKSGDKVIKVASTEIKKDLKLQKK